MDWISVKDKLPPYNRPVLVIDDEDEQWIMIYDKTYGWRCPEEGWSMNVTHWMEKPPPPKR